MRKALVDGGIVREILDSGTNPFPPFDAGLNWVICPAGLVGDGYDGTNFVTSPGAFYSWNGSAWVLDIAAQSASTLATSDAAAKSTAQADVVVQYLINHTPAECSAYVAANVTNLASAVSLLQKMAMALSVLAKQSLR